MATNEIEALIERVVLLEGGQVPVDRDAGELRQASGGSIEAFVREGRWRRGILRTSGEANSGLSSVPYG